MALHIPDMSAVVCQSDFSRKQHKGTMITDQGVETLDYALIACTTRPDFFLGMRASVVTFCFCVIGTPDLFFLETAFMSADFLFDASEFVLIVPIQHAVNSQIEQRQFCV